MRVLLLLFFAFSVHAQSFQYRLQGSFATTASPDPTNPTIVNYTISWNETSTSLAGIYQDNYFTQGTPQTLSGTVAASGRAMTVILPQAVNDVRQLSFLTDRTTSGSASMTITTRDSIGSVIDSPSSFALVETVAIPTVANGTNDGSCTVGFGMLTGACGIYNGTFNEIRDNNNRCSLLTTGNPRLELGENTAFSMRLNYIPGSANRESHTIGTFPPSPQNLTVDVTSRTCNNLPGTTFVSGNCKTLNLNGIFTQGPDGNNQFTGTYSITDDVNADSCAYTMYLTRELSY